MKHMNEMMGVKTKEENEEHSRSFDGYEGRKINQKVIL
jgi:hypothetical protein